MSRNPPAFVAVVGTWNFVLGLALLGFAIWGIADSQQAGRTTVSEWMETESITRVVEHLGQSIPGYGIFTAAVVLICLGLALSYFLSAIGLLMSKAWGWRLCKIAGIVGLVVVVVNVTLQLVANLFLEDFMEPPLLQPVTQTSPLIELGTGRRIGTQTTTFQKAVTRRSNVMQTHFWLTVTTGTLLGIQSLLLIFVMRSRQVVMHFAPPQGQEKSNGLPQTTP